VGQTISDWIIASKGEGLEGLVSNKLEDYRRLKNSGLPIFDNLIISYKSFKKSNAQLKEFLSNYDSFTVRAIPETEDLPRRYKIGVHSFKECKNFLEQVIKKGNGDIYSVFLTVYEPNIKSGIIISKKDEVIVEVSDYVLDKFSHGEDPSSSCTIGLTALGGISSKATWWKKGSPKDEEIIKKALEYITLGRSRSDFLFMKGYFEFIVTETNEIKFLDFKTAKGYLR